MLRYTVNTALTTDIADLFYTGDSFDSRNDAIDHAVAFDADARVDAYPLGLIAIIDTADNSITYMITRR